MKKIRINYHIEVPEDQVDKLCFKTQSSKREIETDIKQMAEISGRHRVYEFIQSFVELNKKEDS